MHSYWAHIREGSVCNLTFFAYRMGLIGIHIGVSFLCNAFFN
jgi:hypothetical protein